MKVARGQGVRDQEDGPHGATSEDELLRRTSRRSLGTRSLPTPPPGIWEYHTLAPQAHRRYRRVVPTDITILNEVLELLARADILAEYFKAIDAEVYELEEEVRAERAWFPRHNEDVPKKKSRGRTHRRKKTEKQCRTDVSERPW